MYRRSDPRFRRTLNEISQTIESANESAQANIFTFSHNYLSPCFSSAATCLRSCTNSCCSARDDRVRRSRALSRGRAELSFDFYDDWEDDDETAGLLAWGNDDLDPLHPASAGYGATSTQPPRQRAMNYGPRRRRSQARNDPDTDPTIIPATSYFGFLGRLTGKLAGSKPLRYRPSAADLQDHPGASRATSDFDDDEQEPHQKRHRRNTASSGGTTDSLSSRGDIFPSEDEDDAVPLDDEFAMVLERRTTGSGLDEASSGKARSGKRPSTGSRLSTRTMSSRSTRTSKRHSRAASLSPSRDAVAQQEPKIIPSMAELKHEEERVRDEEEAIIARRREAARSLASRRGLGVSEDATSPTIEGKPSPIPSPVNDQGDEPDEDSKISTPTSPDDDQGDEPDEEFKLPPSTSPQNDNETSPFPTFDPPPEEDASEFIPAQLPRFSGA